MPSRVLTLRLLIPSITLGLRFLGHPTPSRLTAWSPSPGLPERAPDGFPRSVGRLVRDCRLLLYAGILSDGYHAPSDGVTWIPSRLGTCLFQRWQGLLYDASTTASLIVSHSHLLDGLVASGSRLSAVLSRFYPLMTSRQAGDDAFT